ncbi:TonB-dependent receptor, partial [Neisseria sp. P0024.S002]
GLGSRGLLGKIGYRFNEDNRIELSHRQEKQYGERALREEFDFSQVLQTDRRTGQYVLDANGNRIPNTATNSPRYRTLTQDTTNLEFKGGNWGFIDQIKTNVYRLNTQRDEVPNPNYELDGEVRTYGANLNLDSSLFDRHTLQYGVNCRTQ